MQRSLWHQTRNRPIPLTCSAVEQMMAKILHFYSQWIVKALIFFSSSKHMASNWLGCMYGVRRREMAPSLPALWLGRKIQRFSGTNQKPELPRPFGTGPLKPFPQGLFFPFLTFLRAIVFLARFRPLLAPTNCPWVSEDASKSAYPHFEPLEHYLRQGHLSSIPDGNHHTAYRKQRTNVLIWNSGLATKRWNSQSGM